MEKIFDSVRELDKRAEDAFNLKNGVLMEHAACGMVERIRNLLSSRLLYPQNIQGRSRQNNALDLPSSHIKLPQAELPLVQIVCGSGDNGGDGYALARILVLFALS